MRRSAPSGSRRRFGTRSQQLRPPVPSGRPPQGGPIRRSPCAWPTGLGRPTGSMGRSHAGGPAARFDPIATCPSDHNHLCPPGRTLSAPVAASLALAQLPPTPLRSPDPGRTISFWPDSQDRPSQTVSAPRNPRGRVASECPASGRSIHVYPAPVGGDPVSGRLTRRSRFPRSRCTLRDRTRRALYRSNALVRAAE